MRYFDTKLKTESSVENENTIKYTDERVSDFFRPLPDGKKLVYDENGLPLVVDI